MREKVIEESIRMVQTDGLKFSVDILAEKMKISKKTVYKYFPTKEALSLAIYEKFYCDAKAKAEKYLESKAYRELLLLYYEAKRMTRREIFNKFNLNGVIFAYTVRQNDALWNIISRCFAGKATDVTRVIVDGTFEKLCCVDIPVDAVIERVMELLC